MDRSSLRTSVVIEVANQEEPEDQKTYQIDFDDLDIPKDYIIDQVFCGENITVFALLEIPEDSKVPSTDQVLDVMKPKSNDGYTFLQRNSSKGTMNHKNLNGFEMSMKNSGDSTMNIPQDKDNGNAPSFYCLKHLSGDYDMLTPERESSELKVLYSKNTSPRYSKATKFKAVSKGVNTDIVQSPKIIQEVQKVVKQNIPFPKRERRPCGIESISTCKPSYEVIEMEMRQSFSSLSSYGDSRKPNKQSIPNFFIVPLLMMDDGVLSHFQSDDKIHKLGEEKEGGKTSVPEKVSVSTITDLPMSPQTLSEIRKNENVIDVIPSESLKSDNDVQQTQLNSNPHKKINSKNAVLNEIKKLQQKLNALIKSIETNGFELDTSEPDSVPEEPSAEILEPSETLLSELNPLNPNWNKYDDLPILSTLTYHHCKTDRKKQLETPTEVVQKEEIVVLPPKSYSIDFTSGEGSSKSQIMRSTSILNFQDDRSKEEIPKILSSCTIIWSEMENRKGARMSKSTTSLSFLGPKFNFMNGLKKSLSFDLWDMKLEVMSLKKIKNASFKLETKPNIRPLQKGEAIMKCEMGDEACNKPKTSNIHLLSLSKSIEKVEDLKLEKKDLETKKIPKEEEGDAKRVFSKQKLLTQIIARKTENIEVHFCNTINTAQKDNILRTEKSLPPIPVKSKGACDAADPEQKTGMNCVDVNKPGTPNKGSRRPIPPNGTAKKDAKTIKKINQQPNKIKLGDKIPKPEGKDSNTIRPEGPETVKQRTITGSRKFTLKGTAESKLHVDRLMKTDGLIGSKLNPEKAGQKPCRLPCQKRESADAPVNGEEKTSKINRTNRKDKDPMSGLEIISEDCIEEVSETFLEVPPTPSGVILELLPEKPPEKLCTEKENQKCTNLIKTVDGYVVFGENALPQEEACDVSLDPGKPVVKSLWALTKVLLFEDGSNKIEILEASLNPPSRVPYPNDGDPLK